jgi:RNA polymerase sigma factor (sigma-70 family)
METTKMELNNNLSDKAKEDLNLVIRAVEKNDQSAYDEIMRRYKDAVFFTVLKMINNRDDAEDLTLDSFGKAFKNIHRYNSNFAFSTWLFRIATNNCIDFIRKKRLNTCSLDQPMDGEQGDNYTGNIQSEALNPEEEVMKDQRVISIRSVVQKLKPKYRQLIEMRYYDELSYEEIAQKLDLPLGTVKAQLFRAKELLSAMLENVRSNF